MRVVTTSIPTMSLLYPNGELWAISVLDEDVSPSTWLTRASYTLTPGYALALQSVTMTIARIAMPSASGVVAMRLQISADGTTWYTIHEISGVLNTHIDRPQLNLPLSYSLRHPQRLRLQRYDESTGGSCSFYATVTGVVYSG